MNKSFLVALKYGLFVTATLIAFFLFLKLFNLHENHWLRLFNGLIMAAGIYFSIKYYKLTVANKFTYVDGFKTGLITGFISTILFTIFMAIYMFHLDMEFTQKILSKTFADYGLTTGVLVFVIFIEGLATTVVLTLAFMQYFKNSQKDSQKK